MKTDHGQKLAGALRAVRNLHSDTSKLLVDCDKHIGGGRDSVFGSYATKDLTWSVNASSWMAEGVYRYYKAGPRLVDGVTVTFWNTELEIEPLLKVARIEYAGVESEHTSAIKERAIKDLCKEWDIWSLFFYYAESQDLDKVLVFDDLEEERIGWARLITVPLVTITRIEDVGDLMRRVIESTPAGPAAP